MRRYHSAKWRPFCLGFIVLKALCPHIPEKRGPIFADSEQIFTWTFLVTYRCYISIARYTCHTRYLKEVVIWRLRSAFREEFLFWFLIHQPEEVNDGSGMLVSLAGRWNLLHKYGIRTIPCGLVETLRFVLSNKNLMFYVYCCLTACRYKVNHSIIVTKCAN